MNRSTASSLRPVAAAEMSSGQLRSDLRHAGWVLAARGPCVARSVDNERWGGYRCRSYPG